MHVRRISGKLVLLLFLVQNRRIHAADTVVHQKKVSSEPPVEIIVQEAPIFWPSTAKSEHRKPSTWISVPVIVYKFTATTKDGNVTFGEFGFALGGRLTQRMPIYDSAVLPDGTYVVVFSSYGYIWAGVAKPAAGSTAPKPSFMFQPTRLCRISEGSGPAVESAVVSTPAPNDTEKCSVRVTFFRRENEAASPKQFVMKIDKSGEHSWSDKSGKPLPDLPIYPAIRVAN